MDLQAWSRAARAERSLHVLLSLLREKGLQGWVVGGAVRDALLGRPVLDYDLAVQGDGLELAREVARRAKFAFVPLDEERRIARLVPRQAGAAQLDVASLTAPTIEGDLMRRDLSVNALGVELGDLLEQDVPHVLDPSGGLKDFAERRIRTPSPACLDDDPLRILRVYRFACQLGFEVDEATAREGHARLALLSQVSPERIRDEVFKILAQDDSSRCVSRMRSDGVLQVALPPLAEGGTEVLARLEKTPVLPPIQAWLGQPLSEGRRRGTLLKLAALLAGVPTDVLRLSTREMRALERLAESRSEAAALVAAPSLEAALPYFEHAQEESVDGAVLALASPPVLASIWEWYQRWSEAGRQPLLRGNDIMQALGIPPGPVVGQFTVKLRRAQTAGLVTSADDARDWLRQLEI